MFHPRIGVKRMISRRKILKIKCIQMSADRAELIPYTQELHILKLSLPHIVLFHLLHRREISRKRRSVFSLRRIPDVVIWQERIARPRLVLCLFMEIDCPYLPVVVKVQHCPSVRCHLDIFTPCVIKSIIIFIVL